MANDEHLAILKQGVRTWNRWRYENSEKKPDLSGADLSKACLRRADLSEANLSEANLSWADLSWAGLSEANLRGANLSEANLKRANLSEANLIGADFQNATLTASSIKDWQINSETNFEEVICEYVYLDSKETERRPINGNFAPGEFASLYKKIIETTDLILRKTPENENTVDKAQNIDVDNNINNQGVQFYSNSTIHTWERLRFRSKTEIKIAEALDRTGVLFVPNSSARLNTATGRENKEADFLICYNGKWGVLEVDGPHHTAERRVEEQERERIFKKNGIKVVERFDAGRCYDKPDEVVQEFFKMIDIGYS
ncbi:pentapeptide repeat-containing protein [Cronbergia sp. UHCC 0137]|uniref:pentapeptide repeat-containing protein n=1 Tax=Cronbergia sp. UHCC 0137 TaxID=3110239 RepID=UPI002B1F0592|nr:pentapeptide repeat-containing protein [Cronbergia sp. UHCC 0137]MEA5621155.1 pentapeptide repeat-containing protein [Cronbergia sp. UHCC 0137]